MRTLIFGRMVVQNHKWKRAIYFSRMVVCNKRSKSMRTITFGRMVVHKRKNKWKRTTYFVFSFLALLKEAKTRCESKVSTFCFWCQSKELGGRMSLRFLCLTPGLESLTSDFLWVITNYWEVAYLEPCRTSMMELSYENNQRL